MYNKIEDLLNATKLGDLLYKKEREEAKRNNCILTILAVIGAIAAVAGIAYAVYKYLTPDYLEDFDDDFEDEYDDEDCDCCCEYGDKATKTSTLEDNTPEVE